MSNQGKASPAPELAPATAQPSGAWQRAVGYATDAPDVSEALTGVLAELVPEVRADAGAVLERGEATCRGIWGCEPGELYPLLQEGGPVRDALGRLEEWSDDPLLLSRAGGADGWEPEVTHLLLLPLRVRGLANGALLLVYRDEAPPPAPTYPVAAAYAGLAALVMENDRLYEEGREALQARDHFLTALNHELRTPATALLLEADLLRAEAYGSLPARLDEAVQRAESHVREMIAVLRRVLDLSEMSEQESPEREDVVQPRQLVVELMRRIEPAAKRKSLALSLHVPRHLPALQTDAARLSRILLHLFSNAIKYTAHGGVQVRLERGMRPIARYRQEPVLVVRVSDTGTGIPKEQLERIFEPFTQVEEGARSDSRTRGLGLGLPLARGLARSLGGDIGIESTPGRGTTATLVLPYYPPST